MVLGIGVVVAQRDDMWNRQLTALSPISKQQGELDASLRADLRGADMRYVASLPRRIRKPRCSWPSAPARCCSNWWSARRSAASHTPSQLLPSLATQRAR